MITKQRKPLAIIAAVVLTLLLAFSTAVPVFADTTETVADNNPKIMCEELDLGEIDATDNYITLPDAKQKDGYIFKGWRVNNDTVLHGAGDVIVKDDGNELHIQAVYEAKTNNIKTEEMLYSVALLSMCMSLILIFTGSLMHLSYVGNYNAVFLTSVVFLINGLVFALMGSIYSFIRQ